MCRISRIIKKHTLPLPHHKIKKTATMENTAALEAALSGKTIVEQLTFLAAAYPHQVSFSTSFGLEDQVITHFIFENKLPIRVFTLDTGRNFQETYSTWNKTLIKYGEEIDVFAPNTEGVEKLVRAKGPNSFYESVENRKECCYIRKVEPLGRALKNQKIWITGIRAEQSANRLDMTNLEWDNGHQLTKFHPLFDWTFEETKAFIKKNGIPYNPLHDKGFVSIGCAPCTRAIAEGEDFRAGRWWWEDASKKECGLHAA
jgi:phosphoadenosine phosphosulfate reductase